MGNAFFYPTDYVQSREHFIKLGGELKKAFPDTQQRSLVIPTRTKMDLTTDALYIPQQGPKKERLVILTAGIHGMEAFTGSAVQIEFLKRHMTPGVLSTTGVLVIHAVNPFGYHFGRRVDEDNVDLNRNIGGTNIVFKRKSEVYKNFEDFLNPKERVDAGLWSDAGLLIQSLVKLAQYGRKQLTQVSIGGQYHNPQGIFYGGQQVQPNGQILKALFQEVGQDYEKILHIDLHTGYGERGRLHFFSSDEATRLNGFDKIFEGYQIDVDSAEDFYKTSGNFYKFTRDIFSDKKLVIPMTFEFGTMDSQTVWGGFLSLRNMIYENQGFHHGFKDKWSEEKVQKDFQDMFNPSDQKWRDHALDTGTRTLMTVVSRFCEI